MTRNSSSGSSSNVVAPSIGDDVALHFPGIDAPLTNTLGGRAASNLSTVSSLFGGETRPEDQRYCHAPCSVLYFSVLPCSVLRAPGSWLLMCITTCDLRLPCSKPSLYMLYGSFPIVSLRAGGCLTFTLSPVHAATSHASQKLPQSVVARR